MAKTKKTKSRYGSKKAKAKKPAKRKSSKGRHLPKMPVGCCNICCRTIFGGTKGMATHHRRHHKGRK